MNLSAVRARQNFVRWLGIVSLWACHEVGTRSCRESRSGRARRRTARGRGAFAYPCRHVRCPRGRDPLCLGLRLLSRLLVVSSFLSRFRFPDPVSLLLEHGIALVALPSTVRSVHFRRVLATPPVVLFALFIAWNVIISLVRSPDPGLSLRIVLWLTLDLVIVVVLLVAQSVGENPIETGKRAGGMDCARGPRNPQASRGNRSVQPRRPIRSVDRRPRALRHCVRGKHLRLADGDVVVRDAQQPQTVQQDSKAALVVVVGVDPRGAPAVLAPRSAHPRSACRARSLADLCSRPVRSVGERLGGSSPLGRWASSRS